MKFTETVIHNFLAITDATVNFADRGLMCIQGVNHADTSADSNGVGKSSIPDALSWCWFGETARGASGDDVINDDAKKDCFVTSSIEDGHIVYTATRYRKHKTGKNGFTIKVFDGLKETDLTKGTEKLTQEVANQIIGCSLDVFVGAIYAGQERMPDLPSMTDKTLKLIIEEASGVTVLEGAYKNAREHHAAAVAKADRIDADIQTLNNKLSWELGNLGNQQANAARWNIDHEAQLAALTTEIKMMLPGFKSLKEKVDKINEPALQGKLKVCDAKIDMVSGENDTRRKLEKELNDALVKIDVIESRLKTENKALISCQAEIDGVRHKIGCPCSECGREITAAEIDSALNAAKTKHVRKVSDLKVLEIESKQLRHDAETRRDVLHAFVAGMTDLAAVNAERASLASQITLYHSHKNELAATQTRGKILRDQLAKMNAEENPFTAQIAKIEAGIKFIQGQIDRSTTSWDVAKAEVELEAEVVKVFAPAGVRARILDDVTPFLNTQTSKYLSMLSDGNIDATWTTLTANSKGELKEKFSIDVTNSIGGKNFKLISGGEKRKVRIATALALQDLVATRASKPIDLFIGDEIDDALDSAGLERLMMVLEDKASERGSVFVISHNELSDHIRQVVVVEKLANRTTKVTEMTV